MARRADRQCRKGAVLTIFRVAETGSTNTDLLATASRGEAREGDWLVAERQTAGRGRQGRAWVSPPGNLYASGLVALRDGDPPAPTLALVAGVTAVDGLGVPGLALKWPNDILSPSPSGEGLGWGLSATAKPRFLRTDPIPTPPLKGRGFKLAGILLERQDDAVVVGVGINLAHYPDLPDRPSTSLAALGVTITPEAAIEELSAQFAHWLGIWRRDGVPAIRAAWLDRAHPVGTPLSTTLPDGSRIDGDFDGLTPDGAMQLRLPDGTIRVIHAGDVFLI